jgi:hypothetical protein
MKKIICLYVLVLFNVSFSQVGIGTTSPTKDLDVNGEMRVRTLPLQNLSNSSLLSTDINGNLGKISTPVLLDIGSTDATTNVDVTLSGNGAIVNNLDLGLSIVVNIPANKDGNLVINYSVPIGISSFTQPSGYYGIRFLKDGLEIESGSRKFAFITGLSIAGMTSVTNTYIESFTSSPFNRTFTYSLNGYLEQVISVDPSNTYRFNMWSPSPPNYNWGRSTMSKLVYIK